jgi:cellulose synthase/poly-beta-1,6-N-acetylglucosamine synthase-like glycosyltransferase
MAFGVRAAAGAASGTGAFDGDFAPDRFPEIDCVRSMLAPGIVKAAEDRAARLGISADRVLVTAGKLDEDDYLKRLTKRLGVAFEPLDGIPRSSCPLEDDRLIESAAAGLLPIEVDDQLCLVVAPRGTAARRISAMIDSNPALAARFRFTSAERLSRFVLRCAGGALTARATMDLKQAWPALSAGPPRWRPKFAPLSIAALIIFGVAIIAPSVITSAVELMLAAAFIAWLALRVCSAFIGDMRAPAQNELPDGELPVYTIMAALYKEAASVEGLLRSIERLDYPAEKLDVIIAVEADDHPTRDAIAARANRMPITVIPVAVAEPRTKPKALNFALPFARGTFTVIYDAEDRPQPDQLRLALQAFRAGDERLACVQARLCIDNTADGWLTRLFTAEYAGQFDVFLPGLTAWGLPLPLGGSSNHFHTATLREIHAWDPYNVTEDADLGMRLARFGYRAAIIDSTTYEEAPAHFGGWLRQRTRWFKGWMQTWLVHMRQPAKLLRDLGLPGFITFQLIVGGNALAALVHPIFTVGLIYFGAIKPIWNFENISESVLIWLYGTSVATGYLASALLGWIGLRRRGLSRDAWILLLTPLHWVLLSLAAWRALYQLVVAPYAWEKTEHGLAKTSRLAAKLTRSLLELERYFITHKASADRARSRRSPKNTSADRRRLPRAVA